MPDAALVTRVIEPVARSTRQTSMPVLKATPLSLASQDGADRTCFALANTRAFSPRPSRMTICATPPRIHRDAAIRLPAFDQRGSLYSVSGFERVIGVTAPSRDTRTRRDAPSTIWV